jgi:hypothetical protein
MIANQSARDQIGMMRAIRLEYVRAIVGIRKQLRSSAFRLSLVLP